MSAIAPLLSAATATGLAQLDPPIPMPRLERGMRTRWLSSAVERELGIERGQLLGRSWYDLFPGRKRAAPSTRRSSMGGSMNSICRACRCSAAAASPATSRCACV
jgi:hypothetical protein